MENKKDKTRRVKKKIIVKKKKKSISRKEMIYNGILIAMVLLILVCGGALIHYKVQSGKSESEFAQLKELVVYDIGEVAENEEETNTLPPQNQDGEKQNQQPQKEEYVDIDGKTIRKEFERLYQLNTDLIGWISIDGTRIDYPVVQSVEDGDFYLDHNFAKEKSKAGVIFVDERVNPQAGSNVIVYGHNMRAGTMFSDLLEYSKEDFYKEHRQISFNTIYDKGIYEVVAAFYTEAYADDDTEHFNFYHYTDLNNKEEFDEYHKNVSRMRLYECADYNHTDSFLTLVTCSYHSDTGRFVVVAKKID